MADDGMLLNFEIGDAPLKSQVKFKGGRWRDRKRAQNGIKRWEGKSSKDEVEKQGPTEKPGQENDDLNRPTKRQRIENSGGGSGAGGAFKPQVPRPNPANRFGQVTSRLFTSNPTPTIAVDDIPVEEDAEPVKPSNAPLSEEASNFLALGLSRRVAQHLSTKLEMKAPTSIQKNTIPELIKEDHDAFLQAETGSGKTLAYLLPIVHRIMRLSINEDGSKSDVKIHRNSGLFAIVLAPTRELCKQIATVLEKVLRCVPWLVSTTVTGGESKHAEKARLRKGVNILIATPGRLADHLDNTKVLDVGTVRWLVLDEGDRMMEMGFEEDIRTIVGKIRKDSLASTNADGVALDQALPTRRVTVLCSATLKDVQRLGEISLEDAIHITATKEDVQDETVMNDAVFAAPSQLKQSYVIAPAKVRLVTLIALLKATFARRGSVMKAIIFLSCADSVNYHFDLLKAAPTLPSKPAEPSTSKESPHIKGTVSPAGYVTSAANPNVILHKLHGSLPQPVRTATLQSFANCKDPGILITTDISSRGLDVPDVDLVVEYDPAFAVADHVHRIGRTARAGRAGKAVLFLQPGCEEGYVAMLKSSNTITPQLYETILQKGLAAPVDVPVSTMPSGFDRADPQSDGMSWKARAEALQLHVEQRLLAYNGPTEEDDGKADAPAGKGSFKSGKGAKSSRGPQKSNDSPLLNAARQAFRTHIGAYATHVHDERHVFDITQLHLGHMAKSFGLREAPGGIGGGVTRRTNKGGKNTSGAHKGSSGGKGDGVGAAGSKRKTFEADDDGDGGGVADEAAARRMKDKMRALMNASSEFNIG
jgi:ATP-dependent RNA helicase DDX31/DBP7